MPAPAEMTVGDLMTTALVTLKESDTIQLADTEMKLGRMRHIPVVDERQHLVGMLSARDVLAALARGKRAVPVGEFMSRHLVTVTPLTPAREAVDLLIDNQFGSLPVLGDEGQLVGIITETDFLLATREAFGPRRAGRRRQPEPVVEE